MSIILPSFAGIVGPISSGGGGGGGAWNDNSYALSFDGSDDYVEVADSDDFSFGDGSSNSAFSYSFWVRVERSSTNVFQHLISKGSSTNSEYLIQAMPPNSYGLNADSIYFALYPGSTSGAVVESPASSISLNTWHHVVCTADGTGNRSGMKIYIDGVSQTLTTSGLTSLTMINSTDPLRFGARSQSSAPNSFLQGKMDEIALFNSELSSSDVTSIYNSGGPDDLASLSPVGWWRMGDNNSGSGTTITDQGSGGNDGTLTNGPTFSTDVPVAPSFNNSRSLSYDGTDDYALASSLSGHAAPFTMSFWFLTSNDANMVPFHYQDNLWFRMVLRSSSDGRRIRFYGSNDSNKTSTGAWVSGQWNHFAATVDSSGNTDLYLNGTYDSTHTGGGISAVTSNFMVGAQWHSGSPISDFNGQLDEVATWNAVLSNGSASVGATAGGDIAAIYNSGVPNDLASASSYDTDRTANLTNWWRMEEGSGTSVANSVTGGTALGLNNDTTFSTDVPVAPSSLTNTYSLSLDGTNDDCTVSNYAQTGSFSLSMWINPQAAISGPIYLFYKEASGVNGMNLDINSNTLRWTLYDDTQHPSPTTALVRYAPCTVAQNQWHHIVVTYDGSTSYTGMNHYIDGVKATSHSSEQNYGTNPTFQSAATSTIYVGTRGLYNNRFPLLVDEVAIFDKELSQSDVDSLRDGTSGQGNAIPADISSMADLDIWLRMEEGSGTSVVNTANSGTYDLTLINGPTFSTNVPT